MEPRSPNPGDGPSTVRIAVFAPHPAPPLSTTPPPSGEKKLASPFLTALADASRRDGDAARFPSPGEEFLGFRLVEELGRGAFARVFLAHQQALAARPVALKVTQRPTREAERLARLQHTNVVPVYSVHEAPPVQVICMPYLGRKTIADLIRAYRVHHSSRGLGRRTTRLLRNPTTAVADSKPAPQSHPVDLTATPAPIPSPIDDSAALVGDPLAVLRVLTRLADGLAHAHDRGILHLDLKPANVLIADDGEPMLLDFNLSFDTANRDRGMVGGTLPYMAIEQLIDLKSRGKGEIDARTDLYSLGVMAYEMLTGVVPFPASGPSDIDTLIEDRRQGCPSIRAQNPLVSPAIEAIVKKLLAPEPKDRYQSAVALKRDLDRHLNDLPLETVSEPSLRERLRKWRRRNPGVITRLLAAATFGLVLGLAWVGHQRAEANARAAASERARTACAGLDRARLDLFLAIEPDIRARGIARAEAVLAAYGLPGDADWTARDDVRALAKADRAALGGELGELALLVAQAKWRDGELMDNPTRIDAAAEALKFNRAARACFAADAVPDFLHRQAKELAAAAGETPPDDPPDRGERNPTTRELFLDAAASISTMYYASAVPLLERVVADQPGHATAQFCLAYCRQQKGEYHRALERYDVAQVLMPNEPLVPYQRGVTCNFLRRKIDAEKEYTRAIELDPNCARAYRDRGQIRAYAEKWKEAEADYTQALKKGSSAIQIHYLRAFVRDKLNDPAGAAADRKAAEKLVPRSDWDFLVRGFVSMNRNQFKDAVADYEEALLLNPRSLIALQNLAHVLADKLDDLPAALDAATRATKAYPEYAPPRIGRAVILARLGKRDDAHREAERAMLLSDDPEVAYQAGCVYAQTSKANAEDARKALELLRKAFQSGYTNIKLFNADRDLDPLREQPDFADFARGVGAVFGE